MGGTEGGRGTGTQNNGIHKGCVCIKIYIKQLHVDSSNKTVFVLLSIDCFLAQCTFYLHLLDALPHS